MSIFLIIAATAFIFMVVSSLGYKIDNLNDWGYILILAFIAVSSYCFGINSETIKHFSNYIFKH